MSTTVGFTGERTDTETGTTDHDARSYQAALRAWITTDQYTDPTEDQGLALDPANSNRMLYAGGNPVNLTDPDGHYIHNGSAYVLVNRNGTRKVTHIGRSHGGRGNTRSYSYNRTESRATIAARAQANKQASAEKWKRDPRSTAFKERKCEGSGGSIVNGRCMTVKQKRIYHEKLKREKFGRHVMKGASVLNGGGSIGLMHMSLRPGMKHLALGGRILGVTSTATNLGSCQGVSQCLGGTVGAFYGGTLGARIGASACIGGVYTAPATPACAAAGGVVGGELGSRGGEAVVNLAMVPRK